MRELYNHCNAVVSNTSHIIHDILPDPDGRGVDMLLEHQAQESPAECGPLAYIDATVLLTSWCNLGHYPAEVKQLLG